MKRTQKMVCWMLTVLMLVSVCAAIPFGVSADTTYTKNSSYSYGDATYANYTVTGNNGKTVAAHSVTVSGDDYLMMVYSGYSASAKLLEQHYQKAVSEGYDVIAMVNGSFFSMDNDGYGCYGRLVEYDVVNGELYTGDDSNPGDSYDGMLCIMSDGTMTSVPNSELGFHLSFNGVEVPNSLGTINKTGGNKLVSKSGKYVDNWSNKFYYFDSHVGDTVPTYATVTSKDGLQTAELSGYEIVCEKTTKTGLRIGGTMYGTIKEIKKGGAGSKTNENEFVLFVRKSSTFVNVVEGLQVGDEVSIAVEEKITASAPITEKANSIVENVNYLVKDGKDLTLDTAKFNKTAAHTLSTTSRWTALGVKEDGSLVFFTTDGAETGTPGNVLQSDVAKVMINELGCVDVVRMDGGGSTAMYLKDNGTGKAGYKQNQGRAVADVIMIVRKSTSPALNNTAVKNELQNCVSKYASKTEKAYKDAVAAANAVLADAKAVSGDYRRAQSVLEAVADSYAKMSDVIASAEKADKGLYTPTCWTNLQNAIDAAKQILASPDAEIKDVTQAIPNLSQALAATGPISIIVSEGKPYVATPKQSDTWPDTNGVELTDGNLGNAAEAGSSAWSGFNAGASSTPAVVVDLGEKMENLGVFSAVFLNMNDWGIRFPSSMTVSISDDNTNFTEIGVLEPNFDAATLTKDGISYTFTIEPAKAVSARYVKFQFRFSSSWAFIGEVQVGVKEEPYGGTVVVGDVSGNGKLDASDYLLLKRYVLKTLPPESAFTAAQLKAADTTHDGKINASDYYLLKRAILSKKPLA